MELEEFRLLERQLSHETANAHLQFLHTDPGPAGPAVRGSMPSSQPYNSTVHAFFSETGAMGHSRSSASHIPPTHIPGSHCHEAAEMAGLPSEHADVQTSLNYAQMPNSWESAIAEGQSGAAIQQQLQMQPIQIEASTVDAASMGQLEVEQLQQASAHQGLADWRERVQWAGRGVHAMPSSAPASLQPLDSRHLVLGASTAPNSSMAGASGQGQPGNVARLNAVHADPQAEASDVWQGSRANVADCIGKPGVVAVRGPIASTSEGCKMSGASAQVGLIPSFRLEVLWASKPPRYCSFSSFDIKILHVLGSGRLQALPRKCARK